MLIGDADVKRTLKPGGGFGFTTWARDNESWVVDLRSAFESLPFNAPFGDPHPMSPNGKPQWTEAAGIEKELKAHGFENIKVHEVNQETRIESATEWLKMFGMMKKSIMTRFWDEETKAKAENMLDEHIIKHLEEKHGKQGWNISWKAMVATCRKPLS
jgi:hypothetical protein